MATTNMVRNLQRMKEKPQLCERLRGERKAVGNRSTPNKNSKGDKWEIRPNNVELHYLVRLRMIGDDAMKIVSEIVCVVENDIKKKKPKR